MAIINGGPGNDTLTGGAGPDTINGFGGHDTLDGGEGADTMNGGTGNDTYYVDDPGDDVNENAGEGYDRIYTTTHYYALEVGTEVENLTYLGTGSFSGYGNEFDNEVIGGQAGDFLYGRDGNDTLLGKGGDDILLGGFGHDFLDGGTGADRMEGGGNNDTYQVDNVGDQVIESAGAGSDRVYTTLSYYVLPDNVENLVYDGPSAFSGYGNALDNEIIGGPGNDFLNGRDGNDVLLGRGGNDILNGGGGRDLLIGGTGADRFAFQNNTTGLGSDADRIDDFVSGTDIIDVSGIDADRNTAGDQAFTYIGAAAFSGAAGELRYQTVGGDTVLQGDRDGDTIADFEIILTGLLTPVASDFVL